jgi:hypothetical protein
MDLAQFIFEINNTSSPLDIFNQFKMKKYQLSKSDLKTAKEKLREYISNRKISDAISIMRAMLLTSPEKIISTIRREGLFRCSKYEYKGEVLQSLVNDMLENANHYALTQEHIEYFQSVNNLLLLSDELIKQRNSLIARLSIKRNYVIKTLLATVDGMFLDESLGNLELKTDSVQAYSRESMAEAFSYLFTLFQTNVGEIEKNHFCLIDNSKKEFYSKLLIDAAKMCQFNSMEILVDAFPYKALKNEKGEIKIEPIDIDLEKSINLGYIQSNMQMQIKTYHYQKMLSKIPSVLQMANSFLELTEKKFLEIKKKPIARYVLQVPDNEKFLNIFSNDNLFLEDYINLKALSIEDYISENEAIQSPVVGNITVIDILKIQRFFLFTLSCFHEAFSQHSSKSDRYKIQLQSCVPVFDNNQLITIFDRILLSKIKAEEILALLTCNTQDASYIDIQYSPIIKSTDNYMFSPAILASSNLIRNILCREQKRLTMRENSPDPMQTILSNTLKNIGFLTEVEVKRRFNNEELEIDIIAYRDEHLFIFECKNSFHPCNVYELRNSYERITHAAKQLEKRAKWLNTLSEQKKLFDSLGWENAIPSDKVITCIAIGNRVFNSYKCNSHPVRQVHELLNLLKSGEIIVGDKKYRTWKDLSFSVDDLVAYLEDGIFIKDMMDSMQLFERQFKIGSKKFSRNKYMIDLQDLTKISSKYSLVN